MSRVKTLADLVAARLAAVDHGEGFTPTVKMFPRFDNSETGALDVCVVSGPHEREITTRGGSCVIVQSIPVVVRGVVPGDYTAIETRIASILDIVDSIEDDLATDGASLGTWRAVEVVQSAPFDYEALLEDGVFQAILTVKYKGLF